jgi:hypothetical protein
MTIDRGAFIDIQNVNAEKHLSVTLIPKETEIEHVDESHRIGAARNTY